MLDSIEIIKFFASFVLLFIILYAVYYYIQNFGTKVGGNGKEIEIIESKMVGKNRFLFLAKIKGKIFLLASDEHGIKVLKEWKESD